MLLRELNQILFSNSTSDTPWVECVDGWAAMFCIFLVGVSAFWLHECLEQDFQRRLHTELAHIETLHRIEHENLLNELLALINDNSENDDAVPVEGPDSNNNNFGIRDWNRAN